jgi:predicted PurR-regulated permease PerM
VTADATVEQDEPAASDRVGSDARDPVALGSWQAESASRPIRPTRTGPFLGGLTATTAIGVLLFITSWAAAIVGPIALGLFVAALAAPLFGRLLRANASPALALAITVGVVVVIGVAVVILAIVSAGQLADGLATYSFRLQLRYPDVFATLESLGAPQQLSELVNPQTLTAVLKTVAGIVASLASQIAFAVVLAALLLLDAPRLARLGTERDSDRHPLVGHAATVARAAVTAFGVRIKVNAITALGMLVLLVVLGVDDALLWAVGTFFLSFVPYLGLIIALIPPAILAFAESGTTAALAVVIGGVILNVIAENVLEPTMTGRALRLSTWLVFAMFFFTVWLIGPIGAVVAMPVTVLIVVVLEGDERTRWIARLLTREERARRDQV